MADTGGLGFQPVLHNLTPEQVAVCYREGDSDSLEVAQYYQEARSIPARNLIPLLTSTDSFISEGEYLTTIENPLLSALEALGNIFDSQGAREIWAIVLTYNIPHAFYRDSDPYGDPIAVASRLHRLGYTAEYKQSNYTYDRRGAWKFFDAVDAQNVFLTSVIDGPTVDAAKTIVDRSLDVDNQTFITGYIYLDPYGKKQTDDQLNFQDSLLDFATNELGHLGLESHVTVDTSNPYTEPVVASFEHDSFYWGWFTPRYSRNLFLNQNERRVFLYNADDDAATDLKSGWDINGSDPWCNIAINVEPGYAACAGAVGPPGEDAYLRPRPFFEALHQGAGLAEAFLYSSPYLEWRILLIGDPLMVVNFPVDVPPEQDLRDDTIPNVESIRLAKEYFAESLAWSARQARLCQETLDFCVQSTNISEELDLLIPLANWRNYKSSASYNNLISEVLSAWTSYVFRTEGVGLNDWLNNNNEKISELLYSALESTASQYINSEFIYSEGEWEYEIVYQHERLAFENIYFEIEIHNNAAFTDLAVSVNSFDDIRGWQYESEPSIFVQIPDDGFPSNFSGRRVRYTALTSDLYLTRTEIYYFRWRALDDNGDTIANWEEDTAETIITR